VHAFARLGTWREKIVDVAFNAFIPAWPVTASTITVLAG
jgi:hypothetical protein